MSTFNSIINKVPQIYSIRDTHNYTATDILNEIKEDVEILVSLGYVSLRNNKYKVDFMPRSVHTLGKCRLTGPNSYTIYMSIPYLKECNNCNDIHNTIMHEVIHTVPGCMNHGNAWLSVGRRLTENYPSFGVIKRTKTSSEIQEMSENRYKYILRCDNCDKEYKYQRKPRYIKKYGPSCYRCGICKQPLVFEAL